MSPETFQAYRTGQLSQWDTAGRRHEELVGATNNLPLTVQPKNLAVSTGLLLFSGIPEKFTAYLGLLVVAAVADLFWLMRGWRSGS